MFYFTVSLKSATPLSPLTISTEVVFLIAAMFLTQQWSAQVCRLMLLHVLRLGFVFTGGTTQNCVVSHFSFFYFFSSEDSVLATHLLLLLLTPTKQTAVH